MINNDKLGLIKDGSVIPLLKEKIESLGFEEADVEKTLIESTELRDNLNIKIRDLETYLTAIAIAKNSLKSCLEENFSETPNPKAGIGLRNKY